jgi:membrane fusion protein, multidrug efflux system
MITETTQVPSSKKVKKRKKALTLLTAFFLFIGLIWFFYWLIWGRFQEYTDDAYVNGNIVQLMSQVPGTVIAINTDDTQFVTQGQVLIKLDPTDNEVALQRAKAVLANTVREVRQYFENAQQAQQTLILRNADLMQAQKDFKRRVGLVGERAISREEMQHYKTAVETAEARYNTALYLLRAAFALVENSHLYTHPMVEKAKANLKTAYLNLQRTTILAPATGYVAKRSVQVGQHVSVNTAMLAIIPLTEVWVDANYKESQLSRLRLGQPVDLYADAYSDVTYHGKVLGLTPGTGSVFSLLPPQNATGNWIKIVQRLPVRIGLDVEEIKQNPLQLGLSMRVTTYTRGLKGNRLSTTPKQKPIYTTSVYSDQLAHANQLIETILKDNAPDMFLAWSKFSLGDMA